MPDAPGLRLEFGAGEVPFYFIRYKWTLGEAPQLLILAIFGFKPGCIIGLIRVSLKCFGFRKLNIAKEM